MEIDVENRRQLALVLLSVLVVTIVASAGFQALSDNPLVPDTTFEMSDAADEYNLSQNGTVDMLVVEHVSGEQVELTDFDILMGSRSAGLWMNESSDWRDRTGDVTVRVRMNGERITDSSTMGSGDTLTVSKIEGTIDVQGPVDVRLRIYHRPSQTLMVDREVELE